MKQKELNDALMDAVAYYDVKAVKELLEQGADPNYTLHSDEDEPDGYIQPTTPLRMVMFRISDSLLEDKELRKFAEIARVLLSYGADPKPALVIAEERYGKYDPEHAGKNLFIEVWDIVANAK